uniref:Uncharacterized protein n=1 Tax=Rhizophora mucronata TaxID=61149 RepID=A0A2P2NBD5_RHIMU
MQLPSRRALMPQVGPDLLVHVHA